jgi:uncharacterized protein YmfQ (DUF2313 family)
VDLSPQDYGALLDALLPGGPAWRDDLTARILEAWAEEFSRLDARVAQLIEEADPRTADELLSEWERLLGLPDECFTNIALSIQDRRRLAWQKLTARGGQSRAFFIALAATLGVPGCTITEAFDGNPHHWRVNVPLQVASARWMNCTDDCTDALQMYQPNLIECPIRERKPAHSEVFFAYLP